MNKSEIRAVMFFKYFVEFLEIYGKENYGECYEVNWASVFSFCNSYKTFDFNLEVENIVYSPDEETFRDNVFSFIEKQVIDGYPIWRLFNLSEWLSNKLEEELIEKENDKDKKYFYKTIRCYRCKHFTDHPIYLEPINSFSLDLSNKYEKQCMKERKSAGIGFIKHYMNCKKRIELLDEKKNEYESTHKGCSRKVYNLKYAKFNICNSSNSFVDSYNDWELNPWTLRRCPYFEEDETMTYEKFIEKYVEMNRIESDDN